MLTRNRYTLINTSSRTAKTWRKTLAMAWIDNKKAYDMVPERWIIVCLTIYKISDEVLKFIENAMKNWRAELTARGKSLTEVKTQRKISQGDAPSPLLFVKAMIPFNHILRKCLGGYKLHNSQENRHQTWISKKYYHSGSEWIWK